MKLFTHVVLLAPLVAAQVSPVSAQQSASRSAFPDVCTLEQMPERDATGKIVGMVFMHCGDKRWVPAGFASARPELNISWLYSCKPLLLEGVHPAEEGCQPKDWK